MSSDQHPDRFQEEKSAGLVRGSDQPDIEAGLAVIRDMVRTLPLAPGVYRMLDAKGEVLYVGKAKALKNRVTNYTQLNGLTKRIQRMIAQTRSMMIVTTENERAALLLEAQLIKHYRPPFNVLLRDDKGFPHILVREDHDFPQILKHRGARRTKGRYFGPFASTAAVTQTLNALQKIFQLRSCSDGFFANRSRPCMLYQIKRCSAPCVERISKADYAASVDDAIAFLSGKSASVQQKLARQMERASTDMEYEMAALYRDRLRALNHVQAGQSIGFQGMEDADIFALASKSGKVTIQAFFIRDGLHRGHKSYFPAHVSDVAEDEILAGFLMQFYQQAEPPRLILLDRALEDAVLIADALTERAGRKVTLRKPQRGDQVQLVAQASRNAVDALDRHMAESATQARIFEELADLFALDGPPDRIEVYDNSHIQGTNAIGAMVVAGPEGFRKNAYRKFNIKRADTAPGDDFAMMREVLERRFRRLNDEDPDREAKQGSAGQWPDLLLIDGGKGQVSAVKSVMDELGIEDVALIGVSKGPDRNAGREIFHFPDGRELTLPVNNPVLFHLQRLRDEAHRFAIGTHRAKRTKAQITNPLDEVPGIGPARKKALMLHFGSARSVREATLEELQRVPGISATVAGIVYDFYHPVG
ncbi:excinuclease ABC subunit UvrC [Aquisediminimonas sediminicola]|uniref:excinuclease ABC subunit UvrC n=1 Tax=Alteraquisediminimonas sediminicola TaxID=2676787 RepID=UPI001C8D277A|nr:excinuclease ABC subunit UvrC [Aquisediminimonas sediminicola]